MKETVMSFRLDEPEITKLERYAAQNKEIGLKSLNQYARKIVITVLNDLYPTNAAIQPSPKSILTSAMRLQSVETVLKRQGALHLELGKHSVKDRFGKTKQFSKFTFMVVESFAKEGLDAHRVPVSEVYRRADSILKALK
jgi:hypothetical protein